MFQSATRLSLWRPHTLGILTFGLVLRSGSMHWMRELARVARQDAWASVIGAGLISLLVGALLAHAVTLYPEARPGRIFTTALGPYLGGLLSLIYILYNLAEAALSGRLAVAMIQFAVLPSTPRWILITIGLMPAAILLRHGIEAVLQYQFTLFWPTLILAALAMGLGLRFADWANFLPLYGEGVLPAVRGMGTLIDALGGLQLHFIYVPYFMQQGLSARQIRRAVWGGTTLVLLLYLYAIVILLVGFGAWEVEWMTWPAMEAVRRTYLAGLFFERLDILFLITLLVATTCTLTFFCFASLQTLRQLLPVRRHPWQLWLCLGLVVGLALLPGSLEQAERWGILVLRPIGLLYQVLLPLLLIGVGLLRAKRRERRA